MVVLVGAAALGPRLGAASQMLYLLLGVAGLPVFAASPILPQGAGRLLGPTGGYLMAYPLAAFVTGWLAARGFDRRYFTSLLAMLAGLATIFAGGVLWLAYFAPGTAGQPWLACALPSPPAFTRSSCRPRQGSALRERGVAERAWRFCCGAD